MAEGRIETEGGAEPVAVMRRHAQVSRGYVLGVIAVAPAPLRDFLNAEAGEPGDEPEQPQTEEQ